LLSAAAGIPLAAAIQFSSENFIAAYSAAIKKGGRIDLSPSSQKGLPVFSLCSAFLIK
jgi:hypothetical protein